MKTWRKSSQRAARLRYLTSGNVKEVVAWVNTNGVHVREVHACGCLIDNDIIKSTFCIFDEYVADIPPDLHQKFINRHDVYAYDFTDLVKAKGRDRLAEEAAHLLFNEDRGLRKKEESAEQSKARQEDEFVLNTFGVFNH